MYWAFFQPLMIIVMIIILAKKRKKGKGTLKDKKFFYSTTCFIKIVYQDENDSTFFAQSCLLRAFRK